MLSAEQERQARHREAQARWKQNNRDKIRLKERKLVVKAYGLMWDDYLALYEKAEGKCQICGLPLTLVAEGHGTAVAACIDHCHETGTVRGILCRACNVGIGNLGDSKERVLNAYKYLEKF